MHNAGVAGLPGPGKVKRIKGIPTSDDLVARKFARSDLDELWVTDITEHRTREGKVYCCAVMDTCSRRIIGWSIDSVQDAHLVVNALDMALQQRRAKRGSIVHADHGGQFTSWAFTDAVGRTGLMPSFGSVGDAFDNAMMESFWSTMRDRAARPKSAGRPASSSPTRSSSSSRLLQPASPPLPDRLHVAIEFEQALLTARTA